MKCEKHSFFQCLNEQEETSECLSSFTLAPTWTRTNIFFLSGSSCYSVCVHNFPFSSWAALFVFAINFYPEWCNIIIFVLCFFSLPCHHCFNAIYNFTRDQMHVPSAKTDTNHGKWKCLNTSNVNEKDCGGFFQLSI